GPRVTERGVADLFRGTSFSGDLLQVSSGEEGDGPSVRRPEGRRGPFRTLDDPRLEALQGAQPKHGPPATDRDESELRAVRGESQGRRGLGARGGHALGQDNLE